MDHTWLGWTHSFHTMRHLIYPFRNHHPCCGGGGAGLAVVVKYAALDPIPAREKTSAESASRQEIQLYMSPHPGTIDHVNDMCATRPRTKNQFGCRARCVL